MKSYGQNDYICGDFFFPDGNAAGKRVYGNIKAIEENGYKTAAFCFRKLDEEAVGAYVQCIHCGNTEVYTIPYSDGLSRLNNQRPYRIFKKHLKQLSRHNEIKTVIMYTTLGTFDFNVKINKLCHKWNIKTVYDYSDYFNVISKNNYIKYCLKKRDLRVLRNRVLPKCDGVIAISRYLANNSNCPGKIVIVPPLSVKTIKNTSKMEHDRIVIAYASYVSDRNSPFSEWKDRIDVMVDCFQDIKKRRPDLKFLLKFIGFAEENFLNMMLPEYREQYAAKITDLGENIVFLGQCSNKEAQREIQSADFTILLRDSKVSTNAGFPTKVSESISLGIPVITNFTSDIGDYVTDLENGIIVPAPSDLEGIISKVEQVLEFDKAQIDLLKEKTEADNSFSYKNFISPVGEFLRKLEVGK